MLPTPTVINRVFVCIAIDSRNSPLDPISIATLPRNGTWKTTSAVVVASPMSRKPINANGIVFPSISSIGRIGVTINCSIVPISFSLTIAMQVSKSDIIVTMVAITPGR
mgnify:CR=1 FL=1